MAEHSPTWIWYELMTTDTAAAARFYGAVVGLVAEAWPDPAMEYTIWKTASGGMGGLAPLPEPARAMGAPPHWMGVVGVADTDAVVARCTERGGNVLAPPFDIPGVGRYAVLADPAGAAFSVLAPEPMPTDTPQPVVPAGEPGRVAWNELWSTDPDAAWAFYGDLFGWVEMGTMDMGPQGTYRMYGLPGADRSLGGIARTMPGQPGSVWAYYLAVDDVDQAADRIRQAGGHVVMAPMDVPGGGRMLMAQDPQGAAFALFSRGA